MRSQQLGLTLAWVLIAATLAQCQIVGGVIPATPVALPSDTQRLGDLRVAGPTEATDAISETRALAVVNESGRNWPNPKVYLVVADHLRGVQDRLVWLVRWDNLNVGAPQPYSDESLPPRPPLQYGYVLVDAHTGEILRVTFME